MLRWLSRAAALALARGVAWRMLYDARSDRHDSNDHRLRHPISIQEGEKTVVLIIGNQRGTLTPAQRADTVALARAWKREATGGIIIDVPDRRRQ